MFGMRVISGIVLLIGTFLILNFGGDLLCTVTALLSLMGLYELYRVKKIEKSILGIWGYATAVFYYILVHLSWEKYIALLLAFAFMLGMSMLVFRFPRYAVEDVIFVFSGVIYVAVMLSYLYKIRISTNGEYLVWLVFIGAWGCDTCAYCSGKLLGKHKLASVLSPKKSVEGAVGGIIGAMLLGLLFAMVIQQHMVSDIDMRIFCVLTNFAVAVVSQIGDLTASAIKRTYGIKDYGTLIPGHGGVMDRFDSVLFSAPVVYLAIKFL